MVKRTALLAAFLLAGCSLKVGSLSDCKVDADCPAKGAGLTCVDGICLQTGNPDGGDGGCESGGCYACPPSSFAQFLNACTDPTDVCAPFDGTRVTAQFPDGGLPQVPALPDAGPPDSGSGTDAGSTDAGAVDAGSGPIACDAINGNPIVYATGSSAAKPFLAALGRVLFNDTDPVTVVYQSAGSCSGVNGFLNGTAIHGAAVYWDPASLLTNNEVPCTLPAGTDPDIVISDVFPQTCTALPNGLPSDTAEFLGPVQTMTFVVPAGSTQKSISAAAAYMVFGFGGQSGVAPWTDDAFIFRRNSGSGTQGMLAAAIGVSSALFKGVDAASSSGVVSKVGGSTNAEATIGTLGDTDINTTVALSLRPLAYQHYDQDCAYLPDSNDTSHDKRNVRDGHYAIWGPLHVLSKIDSGGNIRNAEARRLVNFVTGTTQPPGGVDLIQVEVLSNLVPTCAMQVSRTEEVGPYASFAPPSPCGCRYELTATGSTTCTACNNATDCPSTAPHCSYGYCEP